MSSFIEFAAKWFGRAAHTYIRQRRKYSDVWYYTHTEDVHDIVMAHGGNKYQGAASYLHDYREDVVTHLIKHNQRFALFVFEAFYWIVFPKRVTTLVKELTDIYTSENFPNQNRKWRKTHEAERIAKISNEGKTIKLGDLFSNTRSIVESDPDFAITYLKEKHLMMKGLTTGNRELYGKVKKQMHDCIDKLNVVV